MHSSKLNKIAAALCITLIPISVFAAGLGKLNVISGLGEPLRADIELLAITPDELNTIAATIASEEAYVNQGIERPASHGTIKIDIVKNALGTPTLRLKSTQPISEPFLDMLIQVDWASGQLLREYTVLLDPPGYSGESSTVQNSSTQTAQVPVIRPGNTTTESGVATGTATQPRRINRNTRNRAAAERRDSQDGAPAPEYVSQRGDSLAKIARDMQPEGISLDQMLVGLYQANPDAFEGNNINRLRVGKVIRQPSQQELTAISRQQASKEVKVQSANWNAYRNKLAGIVADSASSDSEETTQSAGGKIKSAAEDQSAPAQPGAKDVVKLSAGDAALTKKEAEDVKSLQAKITALQEESTAREKSIREAQEKTVVLEKQIADMQKLLALKNGAMSDIQKQAETQAALDQAKAIQDKTAEQQTKPAEPATTSEPAPANNQSTVPTNPPTPDLKKPDAKVTPSTQAAVPEAIEQPGLLDGLDLTLLGGSLGLLALLGGGWMILRNKRKRNLADFEQGIMTSGGLKANTVFGNTSGSSVDTGDTSFLTDFSQSANGGMIDTNDVDPIAEAEVYMAYGRDAQAEEILKDAISKEPKRYELHLKLLEMYAASKSISAFETIAGELYTSLGPEDSTWAKVAEIGHKLEPTNPLYQASTHTVSSEKPSHDNQNDQLDADDFSNTPIASETDLDFSFDSDSLNQDFASPTISKSVISQNDSEENKALDNLPINDTFELNTDDNMESNSTENLAFNIEKIPEHEVSRKEEPSKSVMDEGLNFDFGHLTSASDAHAEVESVTDTDEEQSGFGKTMPGLDMSGFSKPQADPSQVEDTNAFIIEEENTPVQHKDEIDFASLNNDFESFNVLSDESDSANQPNEKGNPADTDFNFDLSALSPEAASYVDELENTANTFDLSGIDLEMPESDPSVDSESQTTIEPTVAEPIEIETKLDLVAAYLDMDDKEGAKELLEEVLKEGGTNQRMRAEALLAKIA